MIYLKISYSFLTKMFSLKNGALFTAAVAPSSFTVTYLFRILEITQSVKKHILLVLIIELGLLSIFMLLTFIDFVTGVQTSFKLNEERGNPRPRSEVFKSHKAWRTFWKSFGITVITFLFMFVAIVAELLKFPAIFLGSVWWLIVFWVMACSFEFYSIGENLAKQRGGEEYPIFKFFNKALKMFEFNLFKKFYKKGD